MDGAAAWKALNEALESNIFKILIVPVSFALWKLGMYFGQRKVEKTGESEEIRRARELVDLEVSMRDGNVSVEQINNLRERLLGKPQNQSVVTATYFVERAEYLHERPGLPLNRVENEVITQDEINQQAAAQYHLADENLSELIARKLADSAEEEAIALRASQESWIRWRDAEAQWDAKTWEGGSIRPLLLATKLEALTRERIASLEITAQLEDARNSLNRRHKPTPTDLAEHLEPGVTSARVRELLGAPHFMADTHWVYRFTETQVEISFDDEVIQEITFALVSGYEYPASLSEVNEYVIGRLTFADLLAEFPNLELRSRSTGRTHEVYTSIPVGIPGTYRTYFFGAVSPFHGTLLSPTEFEWDFENDGVKGFPAESLINWFGTTSRFDMDPMASWYIK